MRLTRKEVRELEQLEFYFSATPEEQRMWDLNLEMARATHETARRLAADIYNGRYEPIVQRLLGLEDILA